MASTKKIGVFISFRGTDTLVTFVSRLYDALTRKGITTVDLDGGIGSDITRLLKEIELSEIAIIVLSENYASSRWCLAELAKIVECTKSLGLIALPVFYGVDPSDVIDLTGRFGDWLKQSVPLSMSASVEIWKAALAQVGHLSGWESGKYRSDAHLIEEIVDHVSKIIGKKKELPGSDFLESNMVEALSDYNLINSGSGSNREDISEDLYREELLKKEFHEERSKEVGTGDWITLFISLILEVLSAAFEQLNHALMAMILAIPGLLLCIGQLIYRARKEHVYWEYKGLRSWFYSRQDRSLFGSSIEYFQLVVALWQCFHSTLGYIFARENKQNPIKITATMLLLSLCLLISNIIKKYCAVPPPQNHEA